MPSNCQHYVTISTADAGATRFDRATGWEPSTVEGLAATLQLPVIAVSMSLREIYRLTPIV
jgi:hypothetical protein